MTHKSSQTNQTKMKRRLWITIRNIEGSRMLHGRHSRWCKHIRRYSILRKSEDVTDMASKEFQAENDRWNFTNYKVLVVYSTVNIYIIVCYQKWMKWSSIYGRSDWWAQICNTSFMIRWDHKRCIADFRDLFRFKIY